MELCNEQIPLLIKIKAMINFRSVETNEKYEFCVVLSISSWLIFIHEVHNGNLLYPGQLLLLSPKFRE